MLVCARCQHQGQRPDQFCTECGNKLEFVNSMTATPQAPVTENELDVVGGRLKFDSDALTFYRDSEKLVQDMPGIFKAVAQVGTSIVGNMESNQVIPLGLIDSVEIGWFQAGLIGKVPVAGDLMAKAAGSIRVFTASGGPRSEQGFGFYKGQEENAQRFVDALKLASANRGRKVEMVSGAAPSETKTCPMCAEDVKLAAKLCRFCGHNFE